jgi:hypothetical protein
MVELSIPFLTQSLHPLGSGGSTMAEQAAAFSEQ